MYKNLAWLLILFITVANGQQNDINSVLQQVEQNNQELSALRSLMESRRLELSTLNNLPDPQVGAYYLPFGDHATGDYSEFEISQTFEFPTVYSRRKGLLNAEQSQLEIEFRANRQTILLKAHQLCVDLVYINKRLAIEKQRQEQARQVFDHVQQLFEVEEIGILELHKAKIAWLQDQFAVQQLENERENLLLALQNLNGNQPTGFDHTSYFKTLEIPEFEELWQEKLSTDPAIQQLRQQEQIATKRLQLAKNKSLPNLTAGFNYQGVESSNYSGIYAGITIPLWSNRNKVNAAQSKLEYNEIQTRVLTADTEILYRQKYNNYQGLQTKYSEYMASVDKMNSQELLYQAYEKGEISFINYYMELQFFRNAIDKRLEMEKELHIIQSELFKHKL